MYIAAVLTDESHKLLLKKYFPQNGWKIYCHHMTIEFAKANEWLKWNGFLVGQDVELSVIGYKEDGKGAAVVVAPFPILCVSNGIPHITVATAPGVKPVYSNELLWNGYDKIEPFELTAIVSIEN